MSFGFRGILFLFSGTLLSLASVASAGVPVELFQSGHTTRSGGGMEINQDAVNLLRSHEPVVKLGGVPLVNGAMAEFTLTEMSVFADDTVITEIRADGTTAALAHPDIRTWHGTDPANPDRALFASADAGGNVKVMVTGDAVTSVTVISPDPGTASYRIDTGSLPPNDFCGTEAIAALVPEAEAQPATEAVEPRADLLYEIELMIDIGYNLNQKLGEDNLRLLDYLTDLFGAVNTIYSRDLAAQLTLKNIYVWATPEPFAGGSTDAQLFDYRDFVRANRGNTPYDLAHYFDFNPGLGGIAWVDVLGSSFPTYRFGVSNIYGESDFPSNINKYYWDTMVTAHEIGHNVGSPHTHCYNPAIDCCFVDPSCGSCASASPAIGTIMSYCHLQFGNGGDINMTFHQRCMNLMRPKIAGAGRVSVYPNQPNALLKGGAQDTYIPSGSMQTTTFNGTMMEAQMVGGEASSRQFTIRNDGTVPLVMTGNPQISLAGSSLLSIESQPAVGTLAPGEATTFAVRFVPLAAGTYSGVVTIPTNDPDTPHYTFGLSARVAQPAPSKSFNWNGNLAIPDGNFYGAFITINATGIPGTIRDVDVSFPGTDCTTASGVAIEHPRMSDLAIMVQSPVGTQCWLMQSPTALSGANFCKTVFDEGIGNPQLSSMTAAAAPYTGTFRPYESLNRFAGEDGNGEWKITAIDTAKGSIGTLRSATLTIIGNTSSEVAPWSVYE